MRRRHFLVRSGVTVASAAALAGCTEHHLEEAEREPRPFEDLPVEDLDLPVDQRYEVAAEGIERAADESFQDLEALESYLDGEGVEVESIEEAQEAGTPIVELEYAVEQPAERGLMDHLGVVAGAYAALVSSARGGDKLLAHLVDGVGRAYGEYEVRRAWATAYDGGELSAREYAGEVVATAKSV